MKKTLRTPETEARYAQARKDNPNRSLEDLPRIEEGFGYYVVENEFPYDEVYSENHIVCGEKNEYGCWDTAHVLQIAIGYAEVKGFHQVIWNTPDRQSVLDIPHVHVVKFRE